MAISRVPGYSLLANLDRQGTDLTITSSGLPVTHWDVTNYRFGVNTTNPQETLHVAGNVLVANGNVYTSGNLTYSLGTPTNQWKNIFVGNVEAINVNLSGTISIGGNISITGNTTGGIIRADELYDSNNRVLTEATNISITGDVVGSGNYNNISVILSNTTVSAGTYGGADNVGQFTVNEKGQIIAASNVAIVVSQIGNILVNDTKLYTSSGNLEISANNIVLTATNGYIDANNAVLTGLSSPVSNSDAVTLQYLNVVLGSITSSLTSNNSSIIVVDDGTANTAFIQTSIDGNVIANAFATSYNFYTNVNIGNFTFSTESITNTGNIILDSQNGIVKLVGDDAVLLPKGDDSTRPANPEEGYFRYNIDRDNIEFWNGNTWVVPGAATITSDTITPDGSGNAFSLSTNATTDGVIVSINGTLQRPFYSYSVSGNVITFTETPLTTDIVEVRHISVSATAVTKIAYGTQTEVLATADKISVTGNIIPSANVTYNLGSNDYRWNNLYLAGNTIVLGAIALKEESGALTITSNGSPVKLKADDPTTSSDVVTLGYLQNQLNAIDTSLIQQDNTKIQIIDSGSSAGNIVVAVDGTNVATIGGNSISLGTELLLSTALAVTEGGTGATTSSDALNNLLPSGEQSGYVLKTSGPGTYYWASESGGGGATVGQQLTTLRQSNTATAGQTIFNLSGINYTPGSGQLRVYINGVRQHPSAYTETDSTSYTLSQGVNAGTDVFAEIDAFSSFNNYANLTYASNIGNIQAVGLTVQGAIDSLETIKAPLSNPVFTGYVKIQNALEVSQGGTGGTTSSDALNNLLPSGEQSGYVLKTSGPGTYYWASESGGGGATIGQQLTTLRQSNAIVSNTTVISLVNGITYTPGTGQLRVYVNGVRQFPSAYTESSNVSYTLSANVVSGDTVFTEVDAFSTFVNFANLVYASNVGNISASGLTVQAAIENLENNKAPLASPVFTGTATFNATTINGLTTLAETTEILDTKSSVTGTVVHDFSTGAIWYYSSISGNVTANITNVPTTDNRVTSVSIVINQGGTGYLVNGLQINGTAQTIRWQGNIVPAPSTNRIDVFTFSLIRAASTWTVLGSATSHG